MKSSLISPAVVVLIFNRPDFTATLIRRLAKVQPRSLFLVADGPRSAEERALCEAAREEAERNICWECEVRKDYAPENLGCYGRVVTGLNWVFEQVDSALVLEDDMLPDESLFPFVAELLQRYRDDERIFTISGFTMPPFRRDAGNSYSFSRYPLTWGWGTWARAWRHYDGTLTAWRERRKTRWLENHLKDPEAADFYRRLFDAAAFSSSPGKYVTPWGGRTVDAWDYQWLFTSWLHNGLSVVPSKNLVANQGFREDSTNMIGDDEHLSRLPQESIEFPLKHPPAMEYNCDADARLFAYWQKWRRDTPWRRLRYRLATTPMIRRCYDSIRRAV